MFAANLPGSKQAFQLLQFCQQFEHAIARTATAGKTFRSSSTINIANNLIHRRRLWGAARARAPPIIRMEAKRLSCPPNNQTIFVYLKK